MNLWISKLRGYTVTMQKLVLPIVVKLILQERILVLPLLSVVFGTHVCYANVGLRLVIPCLGYVCQMRYTERLVCDKNKIIERLVLISDSFNQQCYSINEAQPLADQLNSINYS